MFDCVKESNCREDIYEARCNMLRRNKVTFVAVKFVWTATLYVTINSLKSHEVIWPGVVIRALAIFRRKRTGGGKSRMYCACLVVRVRQVIFPRFYCALNGVSPRRSFWETTVLPVTTILPQVGVSFLLSLASLIMLVCGVGVGVPTSYGLASRVAQETGSKLSLLMKKTTSVQRLPKRANNRRIQWDLSRNNGTVKWYTAVN